MRPQTTAPATSRTALDPRRVGSGPRLSTRLRTAILFCRAWGYTAGETLRELRAYPLDFNLSHADEAWLKGKSAARTVRRYFRPDLGRDNRRLLAEAREYVATVVRDLPIASKEGRLKLLDRAARRLRNTAVEKRNTELGVAAERGLVRVLKEARLETTRVGYCGQFCRSAESSIQVRPPLSRIAGVDLATVSLQELERELLLEISAIVDGIPGFRERAIAHLLKGIADAESLVAKGLVVSEPAEMS